MVLQAIKASKSIISFAPASTAARDFSAVADLVEDLPLNDAISGGLQFFVERMASSQAASG